MIEIEQLTKQFGDLRAVNDVSLTVPTGEFFVILGPNAAGKTTTIKVMAGLMKPTRGAVRICGFDGATDPLEARRRLAYVPDFPFLYDKLTPAEFFRFTGKLFGMEDAAMEAEAGRLAKRLPGHPRWASSGWRTTMPCGLAAHAFASTASRPSCPAIVPSRFW